MKVKFIKDFAGHITGNVIETDVSTARYLVSQGAVEEFKGWDIPSKTADVPKELGKEDALKVLQETEVKEIPYPEMVKLVATLGLSSNGATKPALIKALTDFKKTL